MNRGRNSIFMLFFGFILILGSGPSHAQGVAGFAAEASVGSVIDQLRGSANDVIQNAQNAVSKGAFEVRQNAEILLQQLDVMGRGLEGKTVKDLTAVQAQFFSNTFQTLQEIRSTASYTTKEARKLVAQSNDMLGTLPFADRTARVLDFSPRFVALHETQDQALMISGSWLSSSGSPSLLMDGKICEPLEVLESSLRFRCKVGPSLGSSVTYKTGTLTVSDRQGWWDRFVGWFYDNRVKRTYSIAIAVVPMSLGQFSIKAAVEKPGVDIQSKTETRRSDNGHCQGGTSYSWTINATSGYSIIEKPTTTLVGDSTAVDEGVQGWTPTSFIFRGKANNSGSCAPVIFGQRAFVDGRGHVEIRAAWKESKSTTVRTEQDVTLTRPVEWGKEQFVSLPEGTVFAEVSAHLLDGRDLHDTSTASTTNHWIRFIHDVANKRLEIKPLPLSEALADD